MHIPKLTKYLLLQFIIYKSQLLLRLPMFVIIYYHMHFIVRYSLHYYNVLCTYAIIIYLTCFVPERASEKINDNKKIK